MKHVGDITKLNGLCLEPVDVAIAGSPCQDLSIAGQRKGLSGERSGLFMEQIRLIKELRSADAQRGRTGENIRPRYMVWENVPGALSSNKSEDFRCVLKETSHVVEPNAVIPRPPKDKWTTAGCIMGDGWSIAWRILDAQFWGVPQRRRRIALVADFGGESAPEILFERESMRGNSETGRTPRERVTADAERGVDATKRIRCVAYSFDSLSSNSMKSKNPHSGCRPVEIGKHWTHQALTRAKTKKALRYSKR